MLNKSKYFFKRIILKLLRFAGYELLPIHKKINFSDPNKLEKATLFTERFREIISDPVNLLIKRTPTAGYVDSENNVILHNGIKVPIRGKYSYYENFSDILIINRGVHEPVEEYCFQELINSLKKQNLDKFTMLELGAYWGHYSMWLKSNLSFADCYLVEPDLINYECGKNNFLINNLEGNFINEKVSSEYFTVDKFFKKHPNLEFINILHSDIQGYELEMLKNSKNCLSDNIINYIFISTHSEDLHKNCIDYLKKFNYEIDVSSGFDRETTSTDGFLMARSKNSSKIFMNSDFLGREEITNTSPYQLIDYLNNLKNKSLNES